MDRLTGKTALVIGGSTGIGRAVCQLFAAEGANVAVGDYGHTADSSSLVTELRSLGRDAIALEVDVRDEGQVRAAIEAAIAHFGQLDILVNNAGIAGDKLVIHEESTEDFDEVMNVNVRGVFFGMKHVMPHMLARGSGRIINTASQLAHKPRPRNAPYSASKAAVVALTVSVAQEVGRDGITVNSVCPGPTDTPMWRISGTEDTRRALIESLPIPRVAEPEEIAWAYVYLASDEAAYCTGQSLSPNGGDVMW
ncbi:MAG: 3-oxoacyl-ACP reductase FabG [Chloroflexota bacterium]|nr:3-oxoacyl-ACP reductase FabG [Chloroflexota bacterium]